MRLSLKQQPQVLRSELAAALSVFPSVELCWALGKQADTPSTAFFIGYQAALRCLDPSLPPQEWSAFLVSEQGVRNPYASHSTYDPATGRLQGEKSHAMLVGEGLDSAYVLAKKQDSAPVELVLLKIEAASLQAGPLKAQPFLKDVAHYPVRFSVVLSSAALVSEEAHQEANKPFRYWEDVHVTLSLAGWLQAQLKTGNKELERAATDLMAAFKQSPSAYTLTTLAWVEELVGKAQAASEHLPPEAKKAWQQDSQLLTLSQAIRHKVRQSLEKKATEGSD